MGGFSRSGTVVSLGVGTWEFLNVGTTAQTRSTIVFASQGSNNRRAHQATRRINGVVNRTHAGSSRGSDSRHHPRHGDRKKDIVYAYEHNMPVLR
ncbi:hypothetical protein Tco_0666432 [Tanacetum coccineum]